MLQRLFPVFTDGSGPAGNTKLPSCFAEMFHTNKHVSYRNSSESDILDYYKRKWNILKGTVNFKEKYNDAIVLMMMSL
jgi:hypothetical protein